MLRFCTLLSLLVMFSCGNGTQTKSASDNNSGDQANKPATAQMFGEAFTPKNVVGMDKLFENLANQDTVYTMVMGTVESVCKKKGCWMNLVSKNEEDNELFVKFKDYGFFMPLDCEGAEVVMNGKAFKEITTVEELQHYAEDEGKSKEEIAAITEPIEEYKFVADGVLMKN